MSRDKFRLLLIKILTLFIVFLVDSRSIPFWIQKIHCGFESCYQECVGFLQAYVTSLILYINFNFQVKTPPSPPFPSFFFFFVCGERRPSPFDCLLLTKVNLIYHSTLSACVIILLASNSNAMLSTKIIHTIFLKLMAC